MKLNRNDENTGMVEIKPGRKRRLLNTDKL